MRRLLPLLLLATTCASAGPRGRVRHRSAVEPAAPGDFVTYAATPDTFPYDADPYATGNGAPPR